MCLKILIETIYSHPLQKTLSLKKIQNKMFGINFIFQNDFTRKKT